LKGRLDRKLRADKRRRLLVSELTMSFRDIFRYFSSSSRVFATRLSSPSFPFSRKDVSIKPQQLQSI